MSEKQHYPKWVFSAERSLIVADESEHASLEGDWYESPADIPAAGSTPSRDEMLVLAEAKGVKVDKRWSDARLSEEVAKA